MHFKIFIVCDKRSFGITGEGGPKGDTLVSVQFYEDLLDVKRNLNNFTIYRFSTASNCSIDADRLVIIAKLIALLAWLQSTVGDISPYILIFHICIYS